MYVKNKADHVRNLASDPLEAARLLRTVLATWYFRFVRRCAGKGSIFGTHNRVINAANVRIGNDCLFKDAIYLRAGLAGRIQIADRVAINSFCQLYGHGGITIGADTQIGPGVLITTTEHDYAQSLSASFKPVTIGQRVWIGASVTVLAGVTIGDGAVIGAGAVVNRDVPPHVLAVGVPARVVRQLGESGSGGGPRRTDAAGPERVSEPPRQPEHDLQAAIGEGERHGFGRGNAREPQDQHHYAFVDAEAVDRHR
jgi:acetyltransferase-like isoleucine patch superfamily enzyme